MKDESRIRIIAIAALVVCAGAAVLMGGCKKKGEANEARVAIKTSLPAGADPTQARDMNFADIVAMPAPPDVTKNDPRYESARIPAFSNPLGLKEGDVVRVRGYLHRVAYMGDGDYNLRLTAAPDSANHFMAIEIPDDDDVDNRQVRKMIVSARDSLKNKMLGGREPSKQGTMLPDAPYVEITGQLYFNDRTVGDPPRTDAQGNQRATNWEIHPGLMVSAVQKPGN